MNIGKILIYIAGICWGIELIPQILKTIRTKNVEDISFAFFALCTFAYVCYTMGNILLKNWDIVLAHIPSVIFTFTMLVLILKYRR